MTTLARSSPFLADTHTREDALHFADFRSTLRDILLQADTPLTVGIYGPWGSGKTSLLDMLRHEIDSGGSPFIRTVWITAWKYDRHEALWRAFILRVLDALWPRKDGDGPREERPRFTDAELSDEGQVKLVRQLSHLEESVYRPVDWEELGKWTVNWWQALREGGKAAAEIAAAFLPSAALFKPALELVGRDQDASDELEKAAQAFHRQVKSYHREQLVHMEQFEKTFGETLKLAQIERLVVFVDDLDRCLPEKALEVLEAIKLFLEVPGTIFVLGMDKEVLERGIETRYREWFLGRSDHGERFELPISGEAYLQKMVQIPFNLPPLGLSDIDSYIESLDQNLPGEAQLSPMTRAVLARGLYPNPRQVKRALNIFRLLKGLVLEREKRPVEEGGLEAGKIAWPLLAKALIIQHQWPELYRDWRQYPTLVRSLEEAYIQTPSSEERMVLGEASEPQAESQADPVKREARATPPEAGGQRGGLLGTYLTERRKYALLDRVLTYPPDDQAGEGRERARFAGLPRSDLEAYLFLVSVAGEKKQAAEAPVDEPLLAGFLSGDLARLQDALDQFNQIEPPARKETQRKPMLPVLIQAMQSAERPPLERATAAEALDALGWLPDDLYQFIQINDRQGGSDSQPSINHPQSTIWIAKYPVTNVQYQAFLDADDFADPELWRALPKFNEKGQPMKDHWGDAGWDWLQATRKDADRSPDGKIVTPRYWRDPQFGIARKAVPVVGVTWFEANAYCRWLHRHWGDPVLPYHPANPYLEPRLIRLPAEAEWARAAGGEKPEGRYPWDAPGQATTELEEIIRRTNVSESGIRRTTPVGMYPLGASRPYGLRDLAGNAWEWQANYYDKDHDPLALRGGSWDDSRDLARVAFRFNDLPNFAWNYYGFRVVALPS